MHAIVHAHGSYTDDYFVVPHGITLVFYTPVGEILRWDDEDEILALTSTEDGRKQNFANRQYYARYPPHSLCANHRLYFDIETGSGKWIESGVTFKDARPRAMHDTITGAMANSFIKKQATDLRGLLRRLGEVLDTEDCPYIVVHLMICRKSARSEYASETYSLKFGLPSWRQQQLALFGPWYANNITHVSRYLELQCLTYQLINTTLITCQDPAANGWGP